MNNVELTDFQLTALSKFNGVRALTETGLSRVLRCEKVVARHAITTLKNAGLIKSLGAYEFILTTEGQLRIGGKAEPDKKAKREADKIPASSATTFKVIDEPSEPEPALARTNRPNLLDPTGEEQPEDLHPAPAIAAKAVHSVAPVTAVNDESTHQLLQADPVPGPSFDELVRAGLERLATQLHYSPVTITDKDLKIRTLRSLSETLQLFDKPVAELLARIAADIKQLPEVRHG